MCTCGGRLFHHCVFPKNHCTATYLCYGGDPRCKEIEGEKDRDCTCAQRDHETGEWGSGGRIKCLQKFARKAALAQSEMPQGHPRDRLSAFAARCLARSKMQDDGIWWEKTGVWCGHYSKATLIRTPPGRSRLDVLSCSSTSMQGCYPLLACATVCRRCAFLVRVLGMGKASLRVLILHAKDSLIELA